MSRSQSASAKRSVEITLLGQRMVLRVGNDPHRVEQVAAYVKAKLEECSANAGPIPAAKIALLAALNIADEYFRLLESSDDFRKQIADKSRALLAELEN